MKYVQPAFRLFPPLLSLSGNTLPRFTAAYTGYYGLAFPDTTHVIGTVAVKRYTVVAQIFTGASTGAGTVVMVHGYYDHGAYFKHLIDLCLKKQYTVVTVDLPGHGLSSGERASIEDFQIYGATLQAVLGFCKEHLSTPLHLISHSTGCSACLELLYQIPSLSSNIAKIVFLAPLVRPVFWSLANLASRVLQKRSLLLPRFFPLVSSDREFIRFIRNDPLQYRRFPSLWFDALLAWNRKMEKRGEYPHPVTIIQGTSDSVVAWRYNTAFLQERIPGCSVHLIGNARHHLHNESEPLRKQLLQKVSVCIAD